ncbi:hypothetical protein IEQ44_13530 [Nocardioides sp. Y6]|uniref:Uncharacterized protein n=1 Tax=Nocardioides malaquae TaxID=2773426 RepID=A0ABR9RVX0_9ACTN|nr:hypothetical protein [Nocardioides malaquae]MBE7325668.1 hypothetical protein [Nocardioides malaquae]
MTTVAAAEHDAPVLVTRGRPGVCAPLHARRPPRSSDHPLPLIVRAAPTGTASHLTPPTPDH